MPDMALPALGGVTKENPIPRLIRPLVARDHKELERSRLVYSIASPQMRMFGILMRNFHAQEEFVASFAQKRTTGVDPLLELDRHMLNYLASANALLDHFDRAFKKRTRAVRKPDKGFALFREELEKTDDIFQFFCEFRHYALHSALPVGHLAEDEDIQIGRTIRITHKTTELLADGRGDLKACRLLQSHDEIELLPLLRSFHEAMMGKVFSFIVECLMPGLVLVQRYHKELAEQVKNVDPAFIPVIAVAHVRRGHEFTWSMQYLPDDIFKELGIQVTQGAPNQPSQPIAGKPGSG